MPTSEAVGSTPTRAIVREVVHRTYLRSIQYVLGTLTLAVSLVGCPPGSQPARDGGRRCASLAECNPSGATCGVVTDCILGFCANTTMTRACPDGAYPPSDSSSGECLQSEDCNPPNSCGPIIACINFNCDRNGPRITIPCIDAGEPIRDSGRTEIDVQSIDVQSIDSSQDVLVDRPLVTDTRD